MKGLSTFLILVAGNLVAASSDKATAATDTTRNCHDAPGFKYGSWSNYGCEYVADKEKCDEHQDGYNIGLWYCPVSCGKCPKDVNKNSVVPTKDCYEYNENIVVDYTNSRPNKDDWMGIYKPSIRGSSLIKTEPDLWAYLCRGNQSHYCKSSYGSVFFGREGTEVSGRQIFPLSPGRYVALLLREDVMPYKPYAESFAFRVLAEGDSCTPIAAPTEAPVKAYPDPTPAPQHAKYPSPAPQRYRDPKPAPVAPTCSQEFIKTDKSCYRIGEPIKVEFDQCYPESNDWIGLYYSSEGGKGDLLSSNYQFWVWACGSQNPCPEVTASGTVVFDKNQPDETGLQSWPLKASSKGYKVHLIRYEKDAIISYLVSDTFVVIDKGKYCPGDNPHAPTPAPVAPTAAPVYHYPDPTPAPVAPTAAPVRCNNAVSTDQSCYGRTNGNDIVITFTNCDPTKKQFVAIYEAAYDPADLPVHKMAYWLWLCGDQHCMKTSDKEGSVTISSKLVHQWIREGTYRAHLISVDATHGRGSHVAYRSYASSDRFVVESRSSRCDGSY